MHNCNAKKNDLIEVATSHPDQNQLARAELENCAACREEFASLRNALRATEAAIHLAQPAESFWSGYHERLRGRLELDSRSLPRARFSLALWLRNLATTSIPVPVPLASALFIFIIFSIFFMMHSRQSSDAGSVLTPPSVITKTVEVPVVQERLVTRVVYRKVQTTPPNVASRDSAKATGNQQPEPPAIVQGLEGFKPANEAKLTIIKGSYKDEE